MSTREGLNMVPRIRRAGRACPDLTIYLTLSFLRSYGDYVSYLKVRYGRYSSGRYDL